MGSNGMNVGENGLFDENGRCIPGQIKAAVHQETRQYFTCEQPKIDYAEIYMRSVKYLDIENKISVGEFEKRGQGILENLGDNPQCENIINGVRVPFILPNAEYSDLGEAFEKIYINGIEGSYQDKYPDYDFTNHFKGSLAGNMQITPDSRYDRLLNAMKESVVVGYYFPCLLEYSVPAAIEQLQLLPEQFLLAGSFDTAAAIMGSPDLLMKADGYPPLLWLSGVSNSMNNIEYHFEAYGYNLTFNRRPHFAKVAEYWASGLVVLG